MMERKTRAIGSMSTAESKDAETKTRTVGAVRTRSQPAGTVQKTSGNPVGMQTTRGNGIIKDGR